MAIYRIRKQPNQEWYTVEKRRMFGWKYIASGSDAAQMRALVAEAEYNPAGVVYQTGKERPGGWK